MTRILVTGASGLLGLNFCLSEHPREDITGVVNAHPLKNPPFRQLTADLTNFSEVARLLDEEKPELVLHCAALANLDHCEQQPELAKRLNTDLPAELARLTRQRGIQLVHISTDAVFDGSKAPYQERDIPSASGVYAETKRNGELMVLTLNPAALVARVNFFGWSLTGTRSLAEFFFNNLGAGKSVMGFTDVIFCPLYVRDLGDVLLDAARKHLCGLYHVTGSSCLTKYEFGRKVGEVFGLDASLVRATSWREAGLKAARSPDLRLNIDKLGGALGRNIPDAAGGLARMKQDLDNGYRSRLQSMRADG